MFYERGIKTNGSMESCTAINDKPIIFMFARDPGGANVVGSLAMTLLDNGFNVKLYGKDFALIKFKTLGLTAINLLENKAQIDEYELEQLIEGMRPKLIITGTSADDFTERFIWQIASKLNITSVAVLDQWVNYGIRFSKYSVAQMHEYIEKRDHVFLPSQIWILDEYAKKQAIEESLPEEKLIVTGQPYFSYLSLIKDKICSNREKAGLNNNKRLQVVFASEPITKTYSNTSEDGYYIGYNEKEILKSVCEAINEILANTDIEISLILRPHPKEDEFGLLHTLDNMKKSDRLHISTDKETESISLLERSHLIIGMSSMFLLEAAVMGIPIMSVQIGLKRESPFILDLLGIIPSIRDYDTLKSELERVVIESDYSNGTWLKSWPELKQYVERVKALL